MRPAKKDGGYAWVVLAANCGNCFLIGVLAHALGVIHVELVRHHGPGDAITLSWAGSVFVGLVHLAGPVSCWLVDRFSCRISFMVGGVVTALGFGASAFTSSAAQIVLTYGLIAGLGSGIVLTATLITVSFRFNKLLALTSGISTATIAIGILTGSIIVQAFIDIYGMTGAFLMLAGMALNCCVFGMLVIPTEHDGTLPLCNTCKVKENRELGRVQATERIPGHDNMAMVWDECDHHPQQGGSLSTANTDSQHQMSVDKNDTSYHVHRPQLSGTQHIDTETFTNPVCEESKAPEGFENETISSKQSVKEMIKGYFKKLMLLFGCKVFLVHCFSVFFSVINISGVYLFLPEYVITLGSTPTSAAKLFIGLGATSLITRIACGVLLSSVGIDGLVLSVFLMGQCGVATCLFHLYSTTYAGQIVFSCLFGMSTGGQYVLINPILKQLGLQTVTTAYGFQLFVMGIGAIVGPPSAEVAKELGGTFTHCFVFLGVAMLMSAFCDLAALLLSMSRRKTSSLPGNNSRKFLRRPRRATSYEFTHSPSFTFLT